MPATTLDGKATAAAIRAWLTERATALTAAGRRPVPGTLLCGDGPGSRWYGGGIAGDVAPDVGEVPGHAASHPGGVGAVPRAMLLRDVVGAAGRAAAPESPSA